MLPFWRDLFLFLNYGLILTPGPLGRALGSELLDDDKKLNYYFLTPLFSKEQETLEIKLTSSLSRL